MWRANLLGGGRTLGLVDRLNGFRTLVEFAREREWDFGEGFIEGKNGRRMPADYITGKDYLPSEALTDGGIDRVQISVAEGELFDKSRPRSRYTPPMLLIREHMNLAHALWTESYLTYGQRIVGFCAPKSDLAELRKVDKWITSSRRVLQAHLALVSPSLFVQKATALQADDIFPFYIPQKAVLT